MNSALQSSGVAIHASQPGMYDKWMGLMCVSSGGIKDARPFPPSFITADTRTVGGIIESGRKTFAITVAGVSAPDRMSSCWSWRKWSGSVCSHPCGAGRTEPKSILFETTLLATRRTGVPELSDQTEH
jgi:hypothetical protein